MSQNTNSEPRNCQQLEQKYVEVLEFAKREGQLHDSLVTQLLMDPFLRAYRRPWNLILFPLIWFKEAMIFMEEQSGHVGEAHRRRMVEIATVAQRSDEPLFQAVTSEFPIGAASDLLRAQLNLGLADLKSLAEIHKLKHSELSSYSPTRILPVLITLFTLAANIVPEGAFEYFGWSNYSQYQAYVFVLTVVTLLYLGLIYFSADFKESEARR